MPQEDQAEPDPLFVLYPNGAITGVALYVWDAVENKYVKWDGSGGGSGGGAVTVADGADVTQGAIADIAVDGDAAGTVNAHLRGISKKLASSIAVTGPLTDTQLRATPVPVSGTVTTGGLTDTQLRATPVPVTAVLTTGSAQIGHLEANQSVNVAQINGVTPLMGAGNNGTGSQRVSIATDDINLAAINAVSGVTTGAAVITDANGTIQQYLRGLIKLAITAGSFLVTAAISTGSNLIGYVGGKNTYAAKATITVTLTSLTNTSGRESTVIDNTSNRYRDALIRVQSKGQTSGVGYVNIYVYEALGDTTYTDLATGSDAAFTVANRFNSRFLGALRYNAGTSAVVGCFKLSDVFTTIPDKWGLIFDNETGATLSATGGDHVVEYEGVN